MRIRNDGYRWIIKWMITISMLSLICSIGVNFFSLLKNPITNGLQDPNNVFEERDVSKKVEDQVKTSRYRVSDQRELVSSEVRLVIPPKSFAIDGEDDDDYIEEKPETEGEEKFDKISGRGASTDSFETVAKKQSMRIVTMDEDKDEEEEGYNREELTFIDKEIKRETSQQNENSLSTGTERIYFKGDKSATLRERYGISEDQQKGCIARINERLGDSFWSRSNNIHDQLQSAIEDLAIVTSCATTREFIIYQTPHFSGGRQQFRRYFVARGWTGTPSGKMMNKSVFNDPLDTTVAVITPCLHSIPFAKVARQVDVISYSPKELENALKIPFYRGIRALFDELHCDYRSFHPESHYLETTEQCQYLLRTLKRELTRQQENQASKLPPPMWFFKDRPGTKRYFVQRGVENVMSYKGRTTQGRSYFLISNYEPATVWLFLGYFNVAAVSQSTEDPETGQPSKSAYVTNMRTNQKSLRLLLAQLMEGRSKEDLIIVKRNIKQAALTAFLALRPRLGTPKPSFSIFGFDFLVQNDLNVKVLETNCNCELFINEENHGKQRVAISTHLVTGAMDIVLASKLNPEAFRLLLESYVKEGTENGDRFRDDEEAVGTDLSETEPHKSWELLYSEAVKPTFSIMNLEEDCVKLDDTTEIA